MEPRSIRLPGADGLSLHALEWSGEGTLLLFLHGFGNSCRVWDDCAPHLAPHYRVIALDQRGHGDSPHDPEQRYEPAAMARDVESVLESLGARRAVLVGHSMGGRVSMEFAGLHPELLAGLVLVDIGPESDPRGIVRISLEVQEQDWTFGSVADYRRVLTRQYPETPPDVLARMAGHWTRERPDGRFELKLDPNFNLRRGAQPPAERAAAEKRDAERVWDILRKLPCPALVVRGAASDILSPEIADRMVDEAIPDAKLAVVPRAAHSVMLDNPDGFRRELCRFALGEG
jgi:pimeloyl-ACP methyl ester carboxylesterase